MNWGMSGAVYFMEEEDRNFSCFSLPRIEIIPACRKIHVVSVFINLVRKLVGFTLLMSSNTGAKIYWAV